MTNSTQRGRKLSRSGVAATSAVSLALGAFSVVGPGPLASAAEEEAGEDTSLTGGIRGDGSGVINTGDQMASDLNSGSCMVVAEGGPETGSQAGFSWDRVEPSNNTTDKRTWGVSVAFDNSQDRTFAYWEWSSSSSNGTPVVPVGSVLPAFVPAAPAGEFLAPEIPAGEASDQADEVLGIFSGPQITYGLQSDLTAGKVAQFAQAGADSPVRYVWKTQYTRNNHSVRPDLQATNRSAFVALVNPWPSENNECNPIKVNWEGIQEHVIVPDEETKVGHIDVPALSDGSVDDSLSRMVVEAYDGNGKQIASSNTDASGSGEQLLRVDANGDIYYTWPEYRGTNLAADKNVQFSVVAKPRTKGELQKVNASHPFYGPDTKVFDSSNSLPRYSKANEIGRNTISLDDTEYHDPQYNTDEQTITSGIETDGSLTDQPQEVVFKQVPDLIADLVKKKGDGGFEAKVVMDQRYVFAGWKAEMDPETYDVTVTSPAKPEPGTFAQPRVVVEYSNGSKDELSLLVIVDPNHTQITDLVSPRVAKGEANTPITSQITTKSIMNGYDPIAPATFEVDQSTVPAGWTVTVDNTGKVTAKADDTVAPGTIITPKVKATYPDGTIDEVEPQFQAIVDIKIPDYDTVTNKPGTEVSLTPTIPAVGLTGNASDEAPTRYTFEDGETEKTVTDKAGTWTIKIDPTTGEITTTIPRTAPEGHILDIPVLAHYSPQSQNKPQKVKGTVVVLKGDIAPVYSVESTGPNQAVDHQVQDAPEGSTFSFGKNPDDSPITEMTTEDGWKYTIDPKTGVVSSTPPAGSKPGDKKTITVDVATPTGDTPKVPVTTVVQLTNSWEAEPSYPAETVYPGGTATLPVTLNKPESVKVAADNPYELGAVPPGWTVSIDNDGKITATAPADAQPGSTVEIPVTVTYEDGSKDTAKAVVNVVDVPTRPVPFGVEYVYDDTIPAGEYKTVTKGVAGEEKQNRDGTWEQTTAPTNEVVHVGTKPAEASKDVTWTAPIPYSTTTRPNPALAPGETKVVQQGVNGERTYTAKFTATGAQASVVESEDTKQPVEEIIEYGPRLDDQELVTETTRKIPFETKIEYDDTLAAGETVVVTQGVVGEETVTSTQKLVDGKPSGDPVVKTTTVTEKKDAVIRVGTKAVTTTATTTQVTTTTSPVPTTVTSAVPTTITTAVPTTVFSTTTEAGTPTTITETKEVPTTITTQVPTTVPTTVKETATATTTEKSTETQHVTTTVPTTITTAVPTTVFSTTTEAGTPTTITETKNVPTTITTQVPTTVPTTVKETETSTATTTATTTVKAIPNSGSEKVKLPFTTRIVWDPTLEPGQQVEDVKGVDGEVTVTFTDGKVSAETTREPVQRVLRVGSKPAAGVEWTEETPYGVKVEEDPNLEAGKYVIAQEGKPGQIVHHANGTETETEATDYLIKVGTKANGQNTETVEADIPFDVKVIYDPNLKPGESKVTQEGKPGTKKVTIVRDIVNSQPGEPTITEEIVKQPVDKVVTVGIKPAEASYKREWVTPLPYDTIVRPNTELKPGEIKIVQEGEFGEKKLTADFSATDGDATVSAKEEVTKEPKRQIIEYGPTIADQTLKTVETRLLDYPTEFILDDTLEAGTQQVEQQGKNGLETITSTQEFKDGKPVGEPKIIRDTQEPKKAIIRVGTKPVTTTATTTTTEQVPTTVKETEKVTETATTTVTVSEVAPAVTTTVKETVPTTIIKTESVPTTITKTESVPTTVTSTVVETTTVNGTPVTETVTKEVPTVTTTTVTETKEVPTTVTSVNNVTTTERSTATETTTTTTTVVNPANPEVRVNGSTIEYWQNEGKPIAIKIRDENVDKDSLEFRRPQGIAPEKLTEDGRRLELPQGTYTIDVEKGEVSFKPASDFTGDVPAVEIDYTRTDGAEVVTPIKVIGHYNDCGCKTTPNNSEESTPKNSDAESSAEDTTTSNPSEPTPTTQNQANPDPSTPASTSTKPSDSKPSNQSSPSAGQSSTQKSPTTSPQTSGKQTTTPAMTTVVTTINGTPTTVTTPVIPTETTTSPETTGGLSTVATPTTIPTDTPDAATVVERCVQNAVRSPLLYLIPLGLLGYGLNEVAGPVIQQAVAPYQDALNRINGELNTRANEIARQYAPEDPFGVGRAGEELNRRLWENQEFARIANQVNDINAQAARLAAQYQPQLEMAGKAAGAILAVTAAGAVLYDWCSNDAGQAWTAVGTDKWTNLRNQQQ